MAEFRITGKAVAGSAARAAEDGASAMRQSQVRAVRATAGSAARRVEVENATQKSAEADHEVALDWVPNRAAAVNVGLRPRGGRIFTPRPKSLEIESLAPQPVVSQPVDVSPVVAHVGLPATQEPAGVRSQILADKVIQPEAEPASQDETEPLRSKPATLTSIFRSFFPWRSAQGAEERSRNT